MPEFIEDEDGVWAASGKRGRALLLVEPSVDAVGEAAITCATGKEITRKDTVRK